jgi:hypothetical protein
MKTHFILWFAYQQVSIKSFGQSFRGDFLRFKIWMHRFNTFSESSLKAFPSLVAFFLFETKYLSFAENNSDSSPQFSYFPLHLQRVNDSSHQLVPADAS